MRKRKVGRPPLGAKAMSSSQRSNRCRAKKFAMAKALDILRAQLKQFHDEVALGHSIQCETLWVADRLEKMMAASIRIERKGVGKI